MSLSVSFRRSARAEFIEAAARYESERQDLGRLPWQLGSGGLAAPDRMTDVAPEESKKTLDELNQSSMFFSQAHAGSNVSPPAVKSPDWLIL